MYEAFAILAIILSVFAFFLSMYSVIITKAQQLSTHRVEYIAPSSYHELKEMGESLNKNPEHFQMPEGALLENDLDIDGMNI